MIIINSIKTLRKEKGLTQAELARMVGVDTSTVCLWEKGERIPKYIFITRLSKIFKCPPSKIVDVR